MPTIRISGGLYACILAIFIYATQFVFLPATVIREAYQEAWLAAAISGLYGLGVALVSTWIALHARGSSVVQLARQSLGAPGAWLVGGLYGAFFTVIFGFGLRNVLDFTVMLLLPGTPGIPVVALAALLALYGSWQGLEPTARVAFTSHLFAATMILALPLFLGREYRVLQLDPFLWEGLEPLARGVVKALPWAGQSLIALTLVPHLNPKVPPYRWTAFGVAMGTVLLALPMGVATLVFGPILPSRFLFPSYELLSVIGVTEALERLQVVLVVIWMAVAFVKLSVGLYAAARTWREVFGVRSHRGPAVAVAAVGVGITQLYTGVLEQIESAGDPLVTAAELGTQGAVLALLALAVLLYRRRAGSGAGLHG